MAAARGSSRRMNAVTTLLPVPILIVDDNAAKRLAVKAVLQPLGFPIVEADSGIAALRCVMEQDFAVILLDVCMPVMDGYETAALIRQRQQSEMTPIIFFTAYGKDDIADIDRYAEGAVDFIFAPVPPNELRAKVSVFANIFIKAEELAARALEVQEALSAARDEADEASRLKSDFLANMSHEIRTPMNGVIGMTDLLLETELDDVQRDYALTVRSSGQALMVIIDDILDFSKIEAGKLEVEHVEFSVRTIVDEVMALLAGPAQAKKLELVAHVERAVPSVVIGDPGRVRQVLTNLIGNAIKFTAAGEVAVRVTAADSQDAPTIIRFEVADTGVGITADKQALIFQPFIQADSSTSRKYGGTGLGLAIVGQLVALMGGTCGSSSELGAGSTFWFTICVDSSSEEDASELDPAGRGLPAATVERPSVSGEGRHLLVVEDNLINQKVAIAMLSNAGYRVDTVVNGEAAVRAAAAHCYDAVLMDCQMPEMNGYEATAAIRAREGSDRHTPIIAITAGARVEDRDRCLAEGMDGYMTKPINQKALLDLLAQTLSMSPIADMTIDVVILDQLHSLGETDDDDFVRTLVDQFILDTEPLLVELRDAFTRDDAETVGRIAHLIKGSSGQLGGRRLASSCGRLESNAAAGSLSDGEADMTAVEVDFRETRGALSRHASSLVA
jgi:signal transduction histidine kinase/HPt (histidine-containing phosphotransfer) domain-containing protein/BarA-like signal transduction histidine kinase